MPLERGNGRGWKSFEVHARKTQGWGEGTIDKNMDAKDNFDWGLKKSRGELERKFPSS